MKRLLILTTGLLAACQAVTDTQTTDPKNFSDFLQVTDRTDAPICTLPITAIKAQLTSEEWEAQTAKAFDFDAVIASYSDDPAAQIKIILRRAALKRRLNVDSDNAELATKFYNEIDDKAQGAKTLKEFHDGFHYYMDRIEEQGGYEGADSTAFNLRFCVLNEYRADLHAASRADLLKRVKAGVTQANPDVIENINHEGIYGDVFRADMLAKVYGAVTPADMSLLNRAKMRSDLMIFSSDPKIAKDFWLMRNKEIDAYLDHLKTYTFETPALKLKAMTAIDQSLRRMFSDPQVQAHFSDPKELLAFKMGLGLGIEKVDTFNTDMLISMLDGRGWFRDDVDGQRAGFNAWLIAQHADRNPDFQQRALTLIEADLDAPGVSKPNYAYLYDRVQMRWSESESLETRTQRYATQGRCTGPGTWEPFPVEDIDNIDTIRAEVGLTSLAEYQGQFKDICTEDQR